MTNGNQDRTPEQGDGHDSGITGDQNRRSVLKTLTAAGLAGAGITGATGSAAANNGKGRGDGPPEGVGDALEEIEIETTVHAEEDGANFEAGDELGTFSGVLEVSEAEVVDPVDLAGSDGDALTAVDLTEGKLEGTFDSSVAGLPSGEVERSWSGSPLLQILDILSPSDSGDCPVLDLELGPLFLDLLGLEVSLSEITLDLTAVAGSGNLLGNLLCAVAGLLDP
ncbi:hypothetical protein [Haloarcula nitratireducens]|uniref:Uncharacterized protein n=1 Tax=Haloarcula nitratireducens TaxID=2487749 RepID=A0AAW4PB78_9EURY|nr:hypothetical protein [Halomicroarcula nitratireducens]MBX0295008.1 hypothetical protein [Halomicroarcula nitratireducens]